MVLRIADIHFPQQWRHSHRCRGHERMDHRAQKGFHTPSVFSWPVPWQPQGILMAIRFILIAAFIPLSFAPLFGAPNEPAWKAGVASMVIPPGQPMWIAGYAHRTSSSQAKATELYAKTLALDGTRGARLVIVLMDLISVPQLRRRCLDRAIVVNHKHLPRIPQSYFHYVLPRYPTPSRTQSRRPPTTPSKILPKGKRIVLNGVRKGSVRLLKHQDGRRTTKYDECSISPIPPEALLGSNP